MPQVDLKYSGALQFDSDRLFEEIEVIINQMDDAAGACKSRAYPADKFLHRHVLLSVMLLDKPHRDEAFMEELQNKLAQILLSLIPQDCYYSVQLCFAPKYYLTAKK